jgi:hypothetical protein
MTHISLSEEEIFVVWAALEAMVEDIHAPQDGLTEEQWELAARLLSELTHHIDEAGEKSP